MPPTSSSPSSLSFSLICTSKEPESCAGTSPPYHLCTISTGMPSAPAPAECGALFRFSSPLNSTVETIGPVESKGVGDPEFDLFRTVVATLSSSNTRGRSKCSDLMETSRW
ncbi:hypothetical protein QQF64_014728 [Cirrhinus molitorella]|uniref:Uncharacterized protein n=2 Tax=Cirrhinus molitorella TaxID=172907 RepID=A0AA88TRH0_9TELE|nr:hypothetical protein Q8A67_009275 [Cirrhinus molitorella]